MGDKENYLSMKKCLKKILSFSPSFNPRHNTLTHDTSGGPTSIYLILSKKLLMALGSIRRQKESEVGLSSSLEEPQCYADMAASHNNIASSANNNSTRCSNLTKTFTAALKYINYFLLQIWNSKLI